LTIGREYVVLGIEGDDYRLLDDIGEPILFDPSCFEVVDLQEPAFWLSQFGDQGERYAYPPGWGAPGFFEAWHDREAVVRRVFAEQLAHWYPDAAGTADDWELLLACFEARARQLEMIGPLAEALGVREDEVFYLWARHRLRCPQQGHLGCGPWSYFFHGYECDLKNEVDGRFLRYDFGPRGRADCLSPWGVVQFIMTSKEPWQAFPDLRSRLAAKGPPYDEYGGDLFKVSAAWERLEVFGCFQPADAALVELMRRCTSVGSDGLNYVRFPTDTPDHIRVDAAVAGRSVLTARANELLHAGRTDRCGSPRPHIGLSE
jgi:hypothetical protein